MKTKQRLYRSMSKLVPKKLITHVQNVSEAAHYESPPEIWLGAALLLGLLVASVVVLIPYAIGGFHLEQPIPSLIEGSFLTGAAAQQTGETPIPLGFPSGIIFFALLALLSVPFLFYIRVYFRMLKRTKQIEKALPAALQIMATNLRAGMTQYQALQLAARKEFGPLAQELDRAAKSSASSLTKALAQMKESIPSRALSRVVDMLASSMRAGGNLASLLDELASDMIERKSLQQELVTATKTHTIFIMFVIVVGAPFLFALSIHFVTMIAGIQPAITGSATFASGQSSIPTISSTISPVFLVKASAALLIITSILASVLIGEVEEGKLLYGLKYAPIIGAASLSLFVVSRFVITQMFG